MVFTYRSNVNTNKVIVNVSSIDIYMFCPTSQIHLSNFGVTYFHMINVVFI